MQDLSLGVRCMVTHRTYMDYDDKGYKSPRCVPFSKGPRAVFVIGKVKKAEGQYRRGSGGTYWDDYEPPSFKAKKYHWFWEVREKLDAEPYLVSDAHIQPELARPIG